MVSMYMGVMDVYIYI